MAGATRSLAKRKLPATLAGPSGLGTEAPTPRTVSDTGDLSQAPAGGRQLARNQLFVGAEETAVPHHSAAGHDDRLGSRRRGQRQCLQRVLDTGVRQVVDAEECYVRALSGLERTAVVPAQAGGSAGRRQAPGRAAVEGGRGVVATQQGRANARQKDRLVHLRGQIAALG